MLCVAFICGNYVWLILISEGSPGCKIAFENATVRKLKRSRTTAVDCIEQVAIITDPEKSLCHGKILYILQHCLVIFQHAHRAFRGVGLCFLETMSHENMDLALCD